MLSFSKGIFFFSIIALLSIFSFAIPFNHNKYRYASPLHPDRYSVDHGINQAPCDASAFRIVYKGKNSSQILDVKSLDGDKAICAGQNNDGTGNDAWLLKTDEYGNILWTKSYGKNENDYFKKIVQTKDGGFLALGSIDNPESTPDQISGYGWAIKTDANGKLLWSYKLDILQSVVQYAVQTKDGGYALVASVNMTGSATGIIVIRVDSNGQLEWMKEFSTGTTAYGYDITQTIDGNLLVSGFVFGMGAGEHDGFLMKINNTDGSLDWLKTYGTFSDEVIDCFAEDPAGNLFLSIYWGEQNQAGIIKTDKDGNVIWAKLYTNANSSSRGHDILITHDGDVVLSMMDADRRSGGSVMKISNTGDLKWAYDYHPSDGSQYSQYAVDELKSHLGFYIVGATEDPADNSFEGYLAKTDENGLAGSCELKKINVSISNISPSVANQYWSGPSISGWNSEQVTVSTPTITRKFICPKCCVSAEVTIDTAICNGLSYTLPDKQVVTKAGTYTTKLVASSGCDSIITTHLSFNPTYNLNMYDTIQQPDQFTLPDEKKVSSKGDYVSNLQTVKGCDSTITTHLFVKPYYTKTVHAGFCENGQYVLPDGRKVSTAGTYTSDLKTISGLDSIITTLLSLNPTYQQNVYDTIKQPDQFTLPDGKKVSATGDYISNLQTVEGCDSVITTHLFVKPYYTKTVQAGFCENGQYTLPDGRKVSTAGTYTSDLKTISGLDSIITTDLIAFPTYQVVEYDTICRNETYILPDGKTVNNEGVYVSNLHTINGCDSIITTHLSFRDYVHTEVQQFICTGDSLKLPDGNVIHKAGIYQAILHSTTSCDTMAVYYITEKAPPDIHLPEDTCLIMGQALILKPAKGYPKYEWSDGSTEDSLKVLMPGLYWVKATNECGTIADSIKISSSCLPIIFIPSAFTPNGDGINDVFRILNVHGQKLISFDIYDRWGERVFHSTNITQGWNGEFHNKINDAGAYVYLIKLIDLGNHYKTYKGTVLLIR